MNTNRTWYPEPDEWEKEMRDASPGSLLNEWLTTLKRWREERKEEGNLPTESQPTPEEDREWIKGQVLAAKAESLPEPEYVTFIELLKKCSDRKGRFGLAKELCELECPSVVTIQEHEGGLYVDEDESGYMKAGDSWLPEGPYLHLMGDGEWAARLAAWVEIRHAARGSKVEIKCLAEREQREGSEMLDSLEADYLEEVEAEMSQQLDEDAAFLHSRGADDVDGQHAKRVKKLKKLSQRIAKLRGETVDSCDDDADG